MIQIQKFACGFLGRGTRRRPGRSGSAALEFGLIGGVFFMLLMGAVDLGRYYLTLHSLHTVLGDAMRAAIIDSTLDGCTAPVTRVAAQAPFLDPSRLTLCVTQSVSSGITTVTVTATYPFDFIVPNWSDASGTLSEQTTATYASTAG